MKGHNLLYFLVETEQGISIHCHYSIATARKSAKAREGNHLKFVRHATQYDVDWVRDMGGFVPPFGAIKK